MKINIFKEKKLEINLPTFVDSRALICANSGGGKSYAVRKILEESADKVMAIILDVEGEFRTLREKFDFLLIGDEGDVKLNMQSAKLIPKKIMENSISTIIDISDLKKSERIKYVKDFLESLMELRKEFWKPCIIVLDEAHMLCGQQEKQDSCGSVIDLMTRGRKRGYCGVLCTQRISKLHKDAVAEANNIMIGRTGLDIDMKRASEILGFTSKQQMLSLRDLDPGEFFVFGTAISRYVTKAKIGEVKTTHPKVGMDLTKKIIAPTKKVAKILSKLKDLPQEAEKKLKEISDYKREVLELKRQIRITEHSKPKTDEGDIDRAYTRGKIITEKKYEIAIKQFENKINKLRQHIIKIYNSSKIFVEDIPLNPLAQKNIEKYIEKSRNVNPPNIETKKPKTIPVDVKFENNGEKPLGLCGKNIYNFLYHNQEKSFSKIQIAVMTGYSIRSSGFVNAISQLNVRKLISKDNGNYIIGDINQDYIDESNIPTFSKELILRQISKCPREILSFLLDNPYDSFSKEEIANHTDYSINSSGFVNAISKLNTLKLIIKDGYSIKLNPELLEL